MARRAQPGIQVSKVGDLTEISFYQVLGGVRRRAYAVRLAAPTQADITSVIMTVLPQLRAGKTSREIQADGNS